MWQKHALYNVCQKFQEIPQKKMRSFFFAKKSIFLIDLGFLGCCFFFRNLHLERGNKTDFTNDINRARYCALCAHRPLLG